MSTEYKNFGDFLNQKRLEKKISYREMAKVLDVSAPYISDIERPSYLSSQQISNGSFRSPLTR